MEPEDALVAFFIAFTCALLVLGAFGACIRCCAAVIRHVPPPPPPPSIAATLQPVFHHQRKLKDSRTVPRVIKHPGGEASIGIVLCGQDGHGG